ncbi:DUF1360 domain-containing protein [Intrasporangium sp. DVR]|uniref:DUF1360 domain-containing protein n=1 Tax=Intrasporangium sp. DVR TaxID=3127867 RepID=UPI00313A6D47
MTTKHQHAGIVEAYAGDEDRPLPGYLASVATYRLSRILTKASITSALRAPLVRYTGTSAPGEVLARRFTRVATSILAVSAASDALQLARAALARAAQGPATSRPAPAG